MGSRLFFCVKTKRGLLMADFIFRISPNIVLGSYSASRLGQFVQEWGTKFMVLMDPILTECGIAAKIKQSLTDRKVDFFVFDDLEKLNIEKVHAIVGRGMGGYEVYTWACEYPDEMEFLVIVLH